MPMFRVCIKDQLPCEVCTVEAEDEHQAVVTRLRDLVDWACLVKLEAEPVEEASDAKPQPCR